MRRIFSTVNLAAAAGYPNVTVPMGYVGFSPHGLSFVGRAFSEARLRRPPDQKNRERRRFCPPE